MKQIIVSIMLMIMQQPLQAQGWVDTTEYPFKSNFVKLKEGKMHYVDEGKGEVILFVHGTPTWSFLYRNFIMALSADYRCIAIDHIGFGLSEKPQNFAGSPQGHANNLSEFIRKKDLQNITLVVHDFGGPIGLAAALDNHERIKKVVLFNTWLWETASKPEAKKVDKIINSRLGKFLYLQMNISPRFLLKKGFSEKKNLPKHIHKQYIKPFPDASSRKSLLNLGRALVGASEWYQQQWERLYLLEKVPWLMVWGTKDEFITTDYLNKWRGRLPNAEAKEFDCGHFVQEEKTKESIALIREFLGKP